MPVTPQELVAAAKATISVCTVETANTALSSHLILDVREPSEYVAGHIAGAINIPRGILEFKIGSHPDFQNKQDANILVYCLTGGRSALATETLNKLGYCSAVSMEGGITAWKESDLKLITNPESCQS